MRLIRADSFIKRLSGLIAYKRIDKDEVMLIKNCRMIHTCFMKFNIDVIFIDKNSKIIRLKENIRPWRLFIGGVKARDVYEAVPGFIKRFGLKKGGIFKDVR